MSDHAIKIELVRLEVENVWQAKLKDLDKERNNELEKMEQRLNQVLVLAMLNHRYFTFDIYFLVALIDMR